MAEVVVFMILVVALLAVAVAAVDVHRELRRAPKPPTGAAGDRAPDAPVGPTDTATTA